mmetsp:Transcript_5865/g.15305  ORF Transcript_5865/g.15305 Transcript_5865/m.15305 type:complete len:220 (+) Transcript_5865:2264-2923(+)
MLCVRNVQKLVQQHTPCLPALHQSHGALLSGYVLESGDGHDLHQDVGARHGGRHARTHRLGIWVQPRTPHLVHWRKVLLHVLDPDLSAEELALAGACLHQQRVHLGQHLLRLRRYVRGVQSCNVCHLSAEVDGRAMNDDLAHARIIGAKALDVLRRSSDSRGRPLVRHREQPADARQPACPGRERASGWWRRECLDAASAPRKVSEAAGGADDAYGGGH